MFSERQKSFPSKKHHSHICTKITQNSENCEIAFGGFGDGERILENSTGFVVCCE